MASQWKDRAYSAYVSSGQATVQSADAESLFAPRRAYLSNLIERHIPSDKDLPIADLGCGHGAMLYFLAQHGYTTLYGVDVSSEQASVGQGLGINVVQQDVNAFLSQLPDASLGVVLMLDVLEHQTMPEAFTLLDEVHRVLRPGGRCILHLPNAEGLFSMGIRYGDITHELALTRKSAHQLLSTVGFKTVRCFEDAPIVHGAKSLARSILWRSMTLYPRLLYLAETGHGGAILSQNFLVTAIK